MSNSCRHCFCQNHLASPFISCHILSSLVISSLLLPSLAISCHILSSLVISSLLLPSLAISFSFLFHIFFISFRIFFVSFVQLGLNFNGQPYRKDLNGLGRSVTLNLVYPPPPTHPPTHHHTNF